MGFDPQAFVSGQSQPPGGFDPIAFLSNKPQQSSPWNDRLQAAAGKITSVLQNIDQPGRMLGNKPLPTNEMGPRGDELFNRAGEAVTDYLGRHIDNPIVPAAAGTIVSMANPENWIQREPKRSVLLEPKVPPARQPAVSAARELGIPLSRAEQTGSPALSGFEAAVEKTPFGSIPLNEARTAALDAKNAALKRLQDEMGTTAGPADAGIKANASLEQRTKSLADKRDALYENVPDIVKIPLGNSIKVADEIINKQAEFLPGTRNHDVLELARQIQEAEHGISSGEGVTGGDVKNYTRQTPDEIIPDRSVVTAHETPSPDVPGAPYTRTETGEIVGGSGEPPPYYTVDQIPGKRIPGKDVYEGGYTASPETKFPEKPNYALVDQLRKTLGGKIEAAKEAKNFTAAMYFTRLKAAVDSDIESFVSSQSTPAGSMIADEFSSAYKKARGFAGAHKELFHGDSATALRNTAPEHIVDSIFKRNNETAVRQFHAQVGEEGFLPAKQRFTQDLLESKNLKAELAKYEPGTLNAIYRPVELGKIVKLADALDLIKESTGKLGSNPMTGIQAIPAGSWAAAGYAIKAGHPIVALQILGLPYLATKALVKTANGIPISALTNRLTKGIFQ